VAQAAHTLPTIEMAGIWSAPDADSASGEPLRGARFIIPDENRSKADLNRYFSFENEPAVALPGGAP
jgi:hypothetical protein